MNDKMDIPDGGRIDINDTDLDVPDLPGEWEWGTVNHYHWNHKVNVYFGLDSATVGGHLGEIDNYLDNDGNEKWTVHTRPIVDDGTESGVPRAEGAHAEEFDSLDEAIDAVPRFITEHYGGDEQ